MKIEKPLISVIVLNWNGKEFLYDCLTSLRNQTFTNFEVIIVDNGSTDNSQEIVATQFPEVKLIPLPHNLGYCGGNNIGIRAAAGDYIVLLNNDTSVDNRWLEELVFCMERHPEAGFCVSKCLNFYSRKKIDSAGSSLTFFGWPYELGYGEIDHGQYDRERELCIGSGVSLMFRKKVLDYIGLFDEDFFTCYEDIDLTFRAFLAGYKGYFVPNSIVYHRRRGTGGRKPRWLVYQTQRNIELFWFKNLPLKPILKGLLHRFVFLAATFFNLLHKRSAITFLKAKIDAIKMLPRFLRKRKYIMSMKTVSHADLEAILEKRWLGTAIRRIGKLLKQKGIYE